MDKPWQESYFNYLRHKGGVTLVMVDRGALEHAGDDGHARLVIVTMDVKDPTPLGIPSGEENVVIQAVADRLRATVEPALDAWHVAEFTGGGKRCDVFYGARASTAEELGLAAACAPYEPQLIIRQDPHWQSLAMLKPTAREQLSGQNMLLVNQLSQRGDENHLPRRIDHLALFEADVAARQAAGELQERGFEVDAPRVDDDGRVVLEFHREDTVELGVVERFCDQILGVVLTVGGTYDGWGSAIVKAAPKPGAFSRLRSRR